MAIIFPGRSEQRGLRGLVATQPREQPLSEDPRVGFLPNLEAGVTQLQAAGQSLLALGNVAVGDMDAAQERLDRADELRQIAAHTGRIPSLDEIDPSRPSTLVSYVTSLVGNQAPILGAFAAGGGVGGALARAAGAGAETAALTGAGLSSGAIESGMIFQDAAETAREQGQSLGRAAALTLPAAAGAAALDVIPVARGLRRITAPQTGGIVRRALRAGRGGAVEEGATEAAQTLVEGVPSAALGGPGVFSPENLAGAGEAGVAGATLGFGLGAVGGAAGAAKEQAQLPTLRTPDRPLTIFDELAAAQFKEAGANLSIDPEALSTPLISDVLEGISRLAKPGTTADEMEAAARFVVSNIIGRNAGNLLRDEVRDAFNAKFNGGIAAVASLAAKAVNRGVSVGGGFDVVPGETVDDTLESLRGGTGATDLGDQILQDVSAQIGESAVDAADLGGRPNVPNEETIKIGGVFRLSKESPVAVRGDQGDTEVLSKRLAELNASRDKRLGTQVVPRTLRDVVEELAMARDEGFDPTSALGVARIKAALGRFPQFISKLGRNPESPAAMTDAERAAAKEFLSKADEFHKLPDEEKKRLSDAALKALDNLVVPVEVRTPDSPLLPSDVRATPGEISRIESIAVPPKKNLSADQHLEAIPATISGSTANIMLTRLVRRAIKESGGNPRSPSIDEIRRGLTTALSVLEADPEIKLLANEQELLDTVAFSQGRSRKLRVRDILDAGSLQELFAASRDVRAEEATTKRTVELSLQKLKPLMQRSANELRAHIRRHGNDRVRSAARGELGKKISKGLEARTVRDVAEGARAIADLTDLIRRTGKAPAPKVNASFLRDLANQLDESVTRLQQVQASLQTAETTRRRLLAPTEDDILNIAKALGKGNLNRAEKIASQLSRRFSSKPAELLATARRVLAKNEMAKDVMEILREQVTQRMYDAADHWERNRYTKEFFEDQENLPALEKGTREPDRSKGEEPMFAPSFGVIQLTESPKVREITSQRRRLPKAVADQIARTARALGVDPKLALRAAARRSEFLERLDGSLFGMTNRGKGFVSDGAQNMSLAFAQLVRFIKANRIYLPTDEGYQKLQDDFVKAYLKVLRAKTPKTAQKAEQELFQLQDRAIEASLFKPEGTPNRLGELTPERLLEIVKERGGLTPVRTMTGAAATKGRSNPSRRVTPASVRPASRDQHAEAVRTFNRLKKRVPPPHRVELVDPDMMGERDKLAKAFNLSSESADRLSSLIDTALARGDVNGMSVLLEDKRGEPVSVLFLTPEENASAEQISDTLAHEYGHALISAFQKDLANSQLSASMLWELVTQHAKWLSLMDGRFEGKSPKEILSTYLPEMQSLGSLRNEMTQEQAAELHAYFTSFDEWVADQMVYWSREDVRRESLKPWQRLLHDLGTLLRRVFHANYGSRERADYSFEEFVFNVQTGAYSGNFRMQTLAFLMGGDKTGDKRVREYLDRIAPARAADAVQSDADAIGLIAEHLRNVKMSAAERQVLGRVFQTPRMITRMRQHLGTDVVRASSDPMDLAAAGLYLWLRGVRLPLSAGTNDVFGRARRALYDLGGVVRDNDVAASIFHSLVTSPPARLESKGLSLAKRETRQLTNTSLQRAVASVREIADLGLRGMYTLYPAVDRIEATGVPSLIRAMRLITVPPGTTGAPRRGYLEAKRIAMERFVNRYMAILDEFDLHNDSAAKEAIARAMHGDESNLPPTLTKAKVRVIKRRLRKVFDDIFDYMQQAGVDIKRREDFFPWVWSHEAVVSRRAELVSLMRSPVYKEHLESQAKEQGISVDDLINRLVDAIDTATVNQEVDESTMVNPDSLVDEPFFGSAKKRSFGWLYTLGGQSERQTLAKFFEPNLDLVMFSYIGGATRLSEFTRRFGQDGSGLKTLLDNARREGATEAQVNMVRNFVKGALGTLGAETNRSLQALFGIPAEKNKRDRVINPTLKNAMGAIMTVTNMATLGLSTLSSLFDWLGIAVRTGDLQLALRSLQQGIAEVQKDSKLPPEELAKMAGVISDRITEDALTWSYGINYMSPKIRWANETFFRSIGLVAWTRATRVMATAAAEEAIVRHRKIAMEGRPKELDRLMREASKGMSKAQREEAKNLVDGLANGDILERELAESVLNGVANPIIERVFFPDDKDIREEAWKLVDQLNRYHRSLRFLDELGFDRPQEIPVIKGKLRVRSPDSKFASMEAKIKNERVLTAINRFVNQSILRPDAAQRPIWASDPHFMLVFHMKSFMYSFYATLIRRAMVEAGERDLAPLFFLLLFAPGMFMLDTIRNILVHGSPIRPDQRHFTLMDHIENSANRAGLMGMATLLHDAADDRKFGGVGIESFLGPDFDVITDVMGDLSDLDVVGATARITPFHNVTKHWFDERGFTSSDINAAVLRQ